MVAPEADGLTVTAVLRGVVLIIEATDGAAGFLTSTVRGASLLPTESVARYETGVVVPAKFDSGVNKT